MLALLAETKEQGGCALRLERRPTWRLTSSRAGMGGPRGQGRPPRRSSHTTGSGRVSTPPLRGSRWPVQGQGCGAGSAGTEPSPEAGGRGVGVSGSPRSRAGAPAVQTERPSRERTWPPPLVLMCVLAQPASIAEHLLCAWPWPGAFPAADSRGTRSCEQGEVVGALSS